MKVIKIRHLEDCSDGSLVKSLLFDQVVTREFIHFLGRAGELTYIASFARPFYQVTIPNDSYLKGVEGLKAARLKLTHPDTVDETLAFLEDLVQQYQEEQLQAVAGLPTEPHRARSACPEPSRRETGHSC